MPSQLVLTKELMEQLDRVQREVNALPYRSDPDAYDKADFWERLGTDGPGDCEDFALEKRWRLHNQGVGFEHLLLATCWIETSEFHAVLIVPTEIADFVLDNRKDDIFTVGELRARGYKFDKMLKPHSPGWQAVL